MNKKIISSIVAQNSPKNKPVMKNSLLLLTLCGTFISLQAFAKTDDVNIGKPVNQFDSQIDGLLADLSLEQNSANENIEPIKVRNLKTNINFKKSNNFNKIDETVISEMAKHKTWRRLLHYRDGEKVSSAKMKPNFFLSPNGASNLHDEMKATLLALQSPDSKFQCRFPARSHWLKEQFNFDMPQADCPNLDKWMKIYNPKQLSIAFIQEYPDRPASAFAHTLLKITSKDNQKYAINYSVAGDLSDNGAVYFVKTTAGKYNGVMTIEDYDTKVKKYLSKDQRDIWTYAIKLNQQEQEQIVRHVWEVKDLGLPYYFLSDNCSSEILRLIDIVRPQGSLYAQNSAFTIPSEVIRMMDDKGLLLDKNYYAADASITQLKNNSSVDVANLNNRSYVSTDTPENDPLLGQGLQRANLTIGQSGEHEYLEFAGRVSYRDLLDSPLGHRQNMDMQTLDLVMRAYSDNKSKGQINSDSLQLQKLTLLAGRSYHPINSARKGGSWGVDISAKQVNDASVDFRHAHTKNELDQQHLVGNIGYQKGIAYALGKTNSNYALPNQLCYSFGGGDVQFSRAITNGYRIGIGFDIGCAFQLGNKVRAKAEVNIPYWYHGDTELDDHIGGYWQPIASLGMQYDVTENQGMRLTVEHELNERVGADTDIKLGWQRYF